MHRFRKRSDAKRGQPTDLLRETHQDALPPLPPASDFRTSLILPDLTRRFSVLRNSSGEPIGLDELKNRFAEQRARGSENRVSEEEEDMILEALGRLRIGRTKPSVTNNSDSRASGTTGTYSEPQDSGSRISVSPSLASNPSVQSSTNASSPGLHGSPSVGSLSSTKGSQVSRRMSNNLFGSGKFHDHTYVRNTQRRIGTGSSSIHSSVKHSESNASMSTITSSRVGNNNSLYSDSQSLRPVTPDGSSYASSVPSSPNNRDTASELSDRGLGAGLLKLNSETLGRASLALDEVIRELEEEVEDEIVMERSPISRGPVSGINHGVIMPDSPSTPISPTDYEPVMAVSSDEVVVTNEPQRESSHSLSRTMSPTPRTPGYVPGMLRPMTPHESNSESTDDHTPSATPRATLPRLPSAASPPTPSLAQTLVTGLYRSGSTASVSRESRSASPTVVTPTAATSPLFFNRSSGRFTPEDRLRNNSNTPAPIDTPDSPILGRRRPLSPLSGPAFQSFTAGANASRPSTPSNIVWNTPSSPGGPRAPSRNGGHSRNGSITSMAEISGSTSASRSVSASPLPDSTWHSNAQANTTSLSNTDYRPPSALSTVDSGSPIANRSFRSSTPTHNSMHSPVSSTFPIDQVQSQSSVSLINGFSPSVRSSKQNGHSSLSLAPPHALFLSPMGNSSRSSLESAGSSYHSWDEEHRRDRLYGIFSNMDHQTEWHDVPGTSSFSTSRTTPNEGDEAEGVVRQHMGLSKSDVVAIQEKLVSAALTKASTPEGRNRANSVRRRRPSTSQSNYSYNGGESRVTSPTPQVQAPMVTAALSRPVNNDSIAKANALLDAVVDSIQQPRVSTPVVVNAEDAVAMQPLSSQPSPGQRHRALARILFGVEDGEELGLQPPLASAEQVALEPGLMDPAHQYHEPLSDADAPPDHDHGSVTPKRTPLVEETVPQTVTPAPQSSTPDKLPVHVDATQLAMEVRKRAEEATAALRKSPSNQKLTDSSSSTRRRISPNQISSPTLLSASTSVDTIPLPAPAQSPQPANASSNKLGSRLKRLRGTLRSKPTLPNGEEITPYPLDLKFPSSAQTVSYTATEHSATEATRSKLSPPIVVSPPASAGPGLKGFMSRFRKQRTMDTPTPTERRVPTAVAPLSASASVRHSPTGPPPISEVQSHSAPAAKALFSASISPTPTPAPSEISSVTPPRQVDPEPTPTQSTTRSTTGEDALRQLFDAANNLGLDQAALNDLLARSPSVRSTGWSRSTATTSLAATSITDSRDSGAHSPVPESRRSIDTTISTIPPRPSAEIRQLTIRKATAAEAASVTRPQQLTPDPQKTIVRRTIIMPSDSRVSAMDLNALMRKQSTSRKRRSAGAASVHSNRSIIDRAPTPPPPRSNGSKRFSTNRPQPPVPQLPQSFSLDGLAPPDQMEKSNSAYDSLYEMYAGETKAAGATIADVNGASSSSQVAHTEDVPESGPAVEVIELANGEMIWSIVNGLRDDDGESMYDNRTSFASEYSAEGVKLSFKEHTRKSSKSSNASFLSRKKQSSNRPETKVFFSSSAQIGRLIENLSHDTDAGSFNITPNHPPRHASHSASSSMGSEADMRWTLEERLEHMLGSMSPNP